MLTNATLSSHASTTVFKFSAWIFLFVLFYTGLDMNTSGKKRRINEKNNIKSTILIFSFDVDFFGKLLKSKRTCDLVLLYLIAQLKNQSFILPRLF